jgi:formate hydrogenlyase subunit 6/NADH:ubiquinone oxidoreductase subunit I
VKEREGNTKQIMSTTKRRGANSTYFGDIVESIKTLSKGLSLTFRHILQATKRRNNAYVSDPDYFKNKNGLVTLQYPYESIPVPDNGRYRLHNEIDDCIVCDKCAKICPVDCITIESIKATEEIGKTSDGTSKRLYAPIFDIDLAKCCYCGLCTTVCPTECLTMTKAYDFSEVDVDNFVYKFSDMLKEEADQKRKELELANAQKEAAKAAKAVPVVKSEVQAQIQASASETTEEAKPAAGPAFKPKVKAPPTQESPKETEPFVSTEQKSEETSTESEVKPVLAKPVFRPKIRTGQPGEATKSEAEASKAEQPTVPTVNETEGKSETIDPIPEEKVAAPRPLFKPKVRPVIPSTKKEEETQMEPAKPLPAAANTEEVKMESPRPGESKTEDMPENKAITNRPVFRPKIRAPKPPEDPSKTE